MAQYGWANCPAAVHSQVTRLIEALGALLGGNLLGVYLHGSLATGCFNPLRSDIDLLVVTQRGMPIETKRRVAQLLLDLEGQPANIEISFLRWDDLHPWRHPAPFDFHYSITWRKKMIAALADGMWQNWNAAERVDEDLAGHITVLQQRGLCLWGQPIEQVFSPVPPDDYLAAVLADVFSEEFGLAAESKTPVYITLNACRTLAYLQTGAVLSKDEGGLWALQALPAKFHPFLQTTLAAYRHGQDDHSIPRLAFAELVQYLRAAIEQAVAARQP